jgi:hypothetical protein
MTDEQKLKAWENYKLYLIHVMSDLTEDQIKRWGVKFEDSLKNAESQIEKLEKELKDPPKVVQ